MKPLRFGAISMEITPRFHPTEGAWGCNPGLTHVGHPLFAQCMLLQDDDQCVIWFGSDLFGETVERTRAIRREIAAGLGLAEQQIIWSTSQTHSSGVLPLDCDRSPAAEFMAEERDRLISLCINAAKQAIAKQRPARVWAGRGYCDSVSYNTRFPLPTGGVKFSRSYREGLQSGKAFDPTISLVRFEDMNGNTLGGIFNFCCHPATMINGSAVSPDWVGTARSMLKQALGGAPVMFCQGFCGDVNCHHLFGTPEDAKRTGTRLGEAAVRALDTLIPARGEPLGLAFETIEVACQPLPSREELDRQLDARITFLRELEVDPTATWVDGINLAEQLTPAQRAEDIATQIEYLKQALRFVTSGERPRPSLPLTLGAVRMGDIGAILAPGENFSETGISIRLRSPFVHTLVCGDTNGLFGYIGGDAEIARGGYETDSYWKMITSDGFRLPPAKGTVDRIVTSSERLLRAVLT